MDIKFLYHKNVTANAGWKMQTKKWEHFIQWIKTPILADITLEEVKELSKYNDTDNKNLSEEEKKIKKDNKARLLQLKNVGCFMFGEFNSDRRIEEFQKNRTMLTLDYDSVTESLNSIINKLKDIEFIIHSTFSHTSENPRYRILIPIKKCICKKKEYENIVKNFMKKHDLNLDKCSSKFNQVMFVPNIPKDGEYIFRYNEGEILDPFKFLDQTEMDFDTEEEPIKKETKNHKEKDINYKEKLKGVKSPIDMNDVIGKFCQTYNIHETIYKYLSDIYIDRKDNIYTYAKGSSLNGLKIYPDKKGNSAIYAYSFHDSDPLNDDHLHNSFDLCKVHLFDGNLQKTFSFVKKELGIEEKTDNYKYNKQKGKMEFDVLKLVDHMSNSNTHKLYNTLLGYYKYENGVYRFSTRNNICKLIANHLNEWDITTQNVNEIYNQLCWKEEDFKIFNTHNNIINFKNCMLEVDYKTGKFKKLNHDPKWLITHQFNWNYDRTKNYDYFAKILKNSLDDDQIILLQEIFGYCLLYTNHLKYFYLFLGPGDTGKSIVLNVLKEILGINNVSALSLQQISNPAQIFITSQLFGKFANIMGDLSKKPLEDSSVIKQLTGGDLINAQKKGKDGFEFHNVARIIFALNELAQNLDKSLEFYNRSLIIPFKAIPEEKKIPGLSHKDFDIEGIIIWALQGLQRLIKNNWQYSITETNFKLVRQYKENDNNIIQFTNECIITKENNNVKVKDLYSIYSNYCIENGYKPLGRNKFVEELKSKGFTYSTNCKKDGKIFRGFKNIDIISDNQDFEEENIL